MPHETGMTELTDEVKGLRGDLREMLTKLFGDANVENPHGRIPRLESQVDNHEHRIGTLEALRQTAGGAWWLFGKIVVGMALVGDLAYHIFSMVRH